MTGRHSLLAATSMLTLMFTGQALAQAETSDTEIRRLDEVTVTAVKREQGLQDVPVSITAFTDDVRQELALATLADFARLTPSLSYSAGDDRVFLRGVGRQTNTNGSDPGVATYVDGVYDSATSSVSRSDFFVERVEVLRGPQGTLYGRNSIGGAINVISKRPTEEFSGQARAYIGNYDTYSLEAGVSGEVAKGLRAKLAGSYREQGEGFFENVAGGPSEGGAGDASYLEFQLEADPSENFSVWLKADVTETDLRYRASNRDGSYDYFPFPTAYVTPGSGFGYIIPGTVYQGDATDNPGTEDIRKFSTNSPASLRMDDAYGLSGIAQWSLPTMEIKYLGGYRTYKRSRIEDLDETAVVSYTYPLDGADMFSGELAFADVFPGMTPNCQWILDNVGPLCQPATIFPSQTFEVFEDKEFWSHELNIQSADDSNVWWIAGLYYYEENLKQESHFNNRAQPQMLAPIGAPLNLNGDFVDARSDLTTRSYAVFGQVDWSVTDTVTLTGGLRYSLDEKEGGEAMRVVGFGIVPGLSLGGTGAFTPAVDITGSVVSFAPAPGVDGPTVINPATGYAHRKLKHDWDAVSGVIGVQWQPDAQSNYFLRYGRGYKSGGFNAGGISQYPLTDKELLDAIEGGIKKSYGSTFQFSATGYYYMYDGLQTPLTVEENGINITRFFNIEESTAHGIELEGTWMPLDNLRFMLSYAYNDSEVDKACCFHDVADPAALQPGAQPVGSPDASGNQGQSLKGQKLPRTVPHKVGVSATYDIDLVNNGRLALTGTYAWQDATYHGIFNRPYTKTPAFDQVDLIAMWTDPTDTYRVTAMVKNVFDEVGYDGAEGTLLQWPAGQVANTYYLTAPRTFGVQLQVNF